ncbi:MAG: hypothetical protein V1659_05270 [Candidatus Woesearchaeota archaeon]
MSYELEVSEQLIKTFRNDPEKHWTKITEIIKETKEKSWVIFYFVLPFIFGETDHNGIKHEGIKPFRDDPEKHWTTIMQIIKETKEHSFGIFCFGFPFIFGGTDHNGIKHEGIKPFRDDPEKHWTRILKDLTEIIKETKEHSFGIFCFGFPFIFGGTDQHGTKHEGIKPFRDDPEKHWTRIKKIIEKNNPFLIKAFFTGLTLIKITEKEEFERLLDIAKSYFEILGESEYTKKLISENLDKLRDTEAKINRLKFEKTGSELIPLGGKLTGYLFRIVTKKAYEAWKKAEKILTEEKDGKTINHCEEIVKAYPRKNNMIAVVTKYAGQAQRSYAPKDEEERIEIQRQCEWIINKLIENNIEHGHPHTGNFTIQKTKEGVIVKIIDFDEAVSP